MRRRLAIDLGIIVAVLAIAGGVGVGWYRAGLQPVAAGGEPTIVFIPAGTGVAGIVERLESAGVLRDATAFRVMLTLSGLGGKLQAGHYELAPTMTAREIAAKLASGDVASFRVTIPEGFTLAQIADRMAEKGDLDRAEFLAAATGAALGEEAPLPLPEGPLEGYLFPETYDFRYDDPPATMVRAMVRELDERFVAPNREAIAARGLSLHEIITLASLVEREARVPQERALIAGVIQHRLDIGMRLQIDATVQYALPEHKSRLTFADLKVDSPYNTYLHAGLPPGPIASPGLPSLMAALRPARTDALFYVARPDGTHLFTRTYEEHQQAIRSIRGR